MPKGEIAKLLGTPFGLSASTLDIDKFLVEKIKNKLVYWCSRNLSLAGRRIIVNQVLQSSMWYFLGVWAGSRRVVTQAKALLRNYFWARRE